MRQFPRIALDITLSEIPCRDCRASIAAYAPIYIIPLTLGSLVTKTCCESCAYREIHRRIALVKDESALERSD